MLAFAAPLVMAVVAAPPDPWLTVVAGKGPAGGKRCVLISGDEEYRSEESMPQLARLLARLGFSCTVLFAIDAADGAVCPNVTNNIPGLHLLADADLMVIATRFRNLPADQMRHVVEYLDSGRPIIGMRTATHAFRVPAGPYRRYSFDSTEPGWEGGFGRVVLGETWVNHHGVHGVEGTRGVAAPGQEQHPILRGIAAGSIFGPTDVYTVRLPLPGNSTPLVLGEVTATLEPTSASVAAKNAPMMPVAWTRTYTGARGKPARVFTTTMGSSLDLLHEGTRRMLANAALWAVGLENRIPAKANVDLVGDYRPTPFRFRADAEWKPGRLPSDMGK
jgi:type 1 glutamine amidotransferase